MPPAPCGVVGAEHRGSTDRAPRRGRSRDLATTVVDRGTVARRPPQRPPAAARPPRWLSPRGTSRVIDRRLGHRSEPLDNPWHGSQFLGENVCFIIMYYSFCVSRWSPGASSGSTAVGVPNSRHEWTVAEPGSTGLHDGRRANDAPRTGPSEGRASGVVSRARRVGGRARADPGPPREGPPDRTGRIEGAPTGSCPSGHFDGHGSGSRPRVPPGRGARPL